MNVVAFIVVVLIVALISVLKISEIMGDHKRSITRMIKALGIESMKEDFKTLIPLLLLDEEKITEILFEFAKEENLIKLREYMEISILHKGNINMQDDFNQTFGHVAVKKRNKFMFDWFLENGGKTDIIGGRNYKTVDEILGKDPEVQMWRAVNE